MSSPREPSRTFDVTKLGLVLLLGAFALDLAWRATVPEAPGSALASEPRGPEDDLTAAMAALEARLARLELRLAALPRSEGREVPAAPHARPATSPEPEAPAASAEEPRPSPALELGTRLEAELSDAGWASAQERELVEAAGHGRLEPARLHTAECRTTLCRVEIESPEPRALDRTLLEVMALPAFAGRQAFIAQDTHDGRGRLTIFLARPGQTLALRSP